jgi:hypothetical protein
MLPYIDCWQNPFLSQKTWLKLHLRKHRVVVARVAAASKCREKCKKPEKPILVRNPEESLPNYVPLCRFENF